MLIKKFKNGNLNLKLEKSDIFYYSNNEWIEGIDIDKIYNDEITMQDLYFNSINGYMYLVDYSKNVMYDFSDCNINILFYLRDGLIDGYSANVIWKLYPYLLI